MKKLPSGVWVIGVLDNDYDRGFGLSDSIYIQHYPPGAIQASLSPDSSDFGFTFVDEGNWFRQYLHPDSKPEPIIAPNKFIPQLSETISEDCQT